MFFPLFLFLLPSHYQCRRWNCFRLFTSVSFSWLYVDLNVAVFRRYGTVGTLRVTSIALIDAVVKVFSEGDETAVCTTNCVQHLPLIAL